MRRNPITTVLRDSIVGLQQYIDYRPILYIEYMTVSEYPSRLKLHVTYDVFIMQVVKS